jgi:hypothetical protein
MIIWEAEDLEGVTAELDSREGRCWFFSLVEGPFSGYPSIRLDRKQLKDLAQAIEMELNPYSSEVKNGG